MGYRPRPRKLPAEPNPPALIPPPGGTGVTHVRIGKRSINLCGSCKHFNTSGCFWVPNVHPLARMCPKGDPAFAEYVPLTPDLKHALEIDDRHIGPFPQPPPARVMK